MNKFINNHIDKIVKDVISQIHTGVVTIGEWKFHIQSDLDSLKFKGKPLNISDKDLLNSVSNYIELARKFFSNDQSYYELDDQSFDKKLFMDLLVNMSNFDAENFESYLIQRTTMLSNKNNYEAPPTFVGQILDCSIEIEVGKNESSLESPLIFRTKILQGKEVFSLPSISFGVVDDCVHIYSIQMKKTKQKNSVSKEFDRYFRKINKNVDMQDDLLSQVSTNAVAVLTIFLAYFKQKGIKNVQAHGFMPLRYDYKITTAIKKLNDKDKLEEFLESHDKNQFNITNKFYNTFMRYAYHFGNNTCYDENKECLEINLTKKHQEKSYTDNIIYDIDRIVKQNIKNLDTNLIK